MKHLGINQLLVASAILAPALASDNSKTDKVTMPLAEVEKQETMSMSLDESSSKAAKVTTAPVSSSIESPQSALSKSGKSSSGNTGKQSNMSMPAHVSLSMLSNGKATKAFGKSGKSVDSKAFKGVNDADSNSLQKGKSDKDMSLSLPYTENKESLKVPSKQPSVTSKSKCQILIIVHLISFIISNNFMHSLSSILHRTNLFKTDNSNGFQATGWKHSIMGENSKTHQRRGFYRGAV